jgi:HEAT repeat protein
MEPVWGGQEDVATRLRGNCALALLQCADISRRRKFQYLVDVAADKAEPVRLDAIRALSEMEGDEATLLLRMKARVGDSRQRVTGAVLEALIAIDGDDGISFSVGFLQSDDDELCEEAALALAASRRPAAVDVLKHSWSTASPQRREILLRAISASGLPDAIDFLLNLIEQGLQRDADAAVQALKVHADTPDLRERVEMALKKRQER